MNWAAREGIVSLFAVFAANAMSSVATGDSLPFSAEAIAGIVSITVAAVGITQARGYMEYRQYSQSSVISGQSPAPPISSGLPQEPPPITPATPPPD